MTPARFLATFLGAGLLRPAPGTWGTLAALPVAWLLHAAGGFPLLAAATVAVSLAGWWAVGIETAGAADPDPSEIVIDEVAGMWLALWPVSLGASMQGVGVTALWPGWIVAFVAFRVFDIWKPGPVGWAEGRPGATGVMLDDLIAGLFAAVTVIVAAAIGHGIMRL